MPRRKVQKILALIAARAGSKGLAHKNVTKLGGAPLLSRAIRLAQASKRRGESWSIVVSTDSLPYARLARRAGAEVPFLRPQRLATDEARLIDVVLHTLRELACRGQAFDAIVLLSAATPLTQPGDVRRALRLFAHGGGVSVASVTEERVPDGWRFRLREGRLTGRSGKVGRRQSARNLCRLHGAIYIATPAWIRRHRQFVVAGRTLGLVMPRERSVDIEDALDLEWAELLLRQRTRPSLRGAPGLTRD